MPNSLSLVPSRSDNSLNPSSNASSHGVEAEIISKVRSFLQENFLYLRPAESQLGVTDRLLEQGVIDSMGVVEMITFLEDTFAIRVAEDEISEANLGSIQAVATFVMSKQRTGV